MFSAKKDPLLVLEEEKLRLARDTAQTNTTDTEEAVSFHKQERQDLLRWQQDLLDDLEQLKHDLRREVYDLQKDVWVQERMVSGHTSEGKPIYEQLAPLMNEQGIRMVESLVRPFLSRNLLNSNLDEQMVYGMLRRSSDTLVNNITYYGEQYDLEFGNYNLIVRLVKNVIIPSPFRAADGWTKRIDSTISKRLESFAESNKQAENEQGFFAKLIKK